MNPALEAPASAQDGYEAFLYNIPDSPYKIILVFNFSPVQVNMDPPYDAITTAAHQIKTVVLGLGNEILFEHPSAGAIDNESSISLATNAQIVYEMTKHLKGFAAGSFLGALPLVQDVLQDYVPNISNLIFESILMEATHEDLFKAHTFNKIPLTDSETKESCISGTGATPILNIEGVREKVNKTAQDLECVVGMFDTPNAQQIATMYGLYNLLIKICIVEEYMKNIFIFGFMKIADILRIPTYMSLLIDNVISATQNISGQDGYDNLLDYASKIIQGRQNLGESMQRYMSLLGIQQLDNGVLGADGKSIERRLSPAECLKILVLEAAEEINDTLDSRIHSVVASDWKKFTQIEAADDLNAKQQLENNLINYVVSSRPEYWSPDLYPHHTDYADNADFPIMRQIGEEVWPERGPQSKPWDGGLFFQPYMRLESKLPSIVDPIVGEENIYSATQQLEQKKQGLNNFWQRLMSAATERANQGAPDITGPLAAVFVKIQNEAAAFDGDVSQSPAFINFFKFFFMPSKGNVASSPLRKAYTSVVSSFDTSQGHQTPTLIMDDAFYYWEKEHLGTASDKSLHWQKRGICSHNQIVDWATTLDASPLDPQTSMSGDEHLPTMEFLINHYDYEQADFYSADWNPDANIAPVTVATLTSKLWNDLRDLVLLSSYDKWFDIKFGMRLNLLLPIEDDKPLSFLSTINEDLNYDSYSKEKIFIWQKKSGEKFLCLPLAVNEKDWKEFPKIVERLPSGSPVLTNPRHSLRSVARAIKNEFEDQEGQNQIFKELRLDSEEIHSIANTLPIKEITTVAALFYRYSMDTAWPNLTNLFTPSKNITSRFIAQSAATVKRDYQFLDSAATDINPDMQLDSIGASPGEIGWKFFLLAVQAGANTVDPTWQTPWFLPGPLTPIGIIAKSLATDWTDDKDPKDMDPSLGVTEKVCLPPPGDPTADQTTEVPTEEVDAGQAAPAVAYTTKLEDWVLVFPDDDEIYSDVSSSALAKLILTVKGVKYTGIVHPSFAAPEDPADAIIPHPSTDSDKDADQKYLITLGFQGSNLSNLAEYVRDAIYAALNAPPGVTGLSPFDPTVDSSKDGPAIKLTLDCGTSPEGSMLEAFGIKLYAAGDVQLGKTVAETVE